MQLTAKNGASLAVVRSTFATLPWPGIYVYNVTRKTHSIGRHWSLFPFQALGILEVVKSYVESVEKFLHVLPAGWWAGTSDSAILFEIKTEQLRP